MQSLLVPAMMMGNMRWRIGRNPLYYLGVFCGMKRLLNTDFTLMDFNLKTSQVIKMFANGPVYFRGALGSIKSFAKGYSFGLTLGSVIRQNNGSGASE